MLTNPKTSRLLVWLSLILLLGFLIYWNCNQYQSEKKELVQDLNDQMNLAYSKYKDSIFTSIFTFIQDDDNLSSLPRSVTIQNDLFKGAGTIDVQAKSSTSQKDTNISIVISSNQVFSTDSSDSLSNMPFHDDLVEPLLSESSGFRDYVKTYFEENLTALDLPTTYNDEYLTEGKQILDGKIAIAYNSLQHEDPKLHATFSDYRPYLIKKISPSLLMSTALFSIMSLAFFMILKTSNEQQRLTDMKSEFISNMTHELKTPIATMGVAIEALSDYGGMNDQKRKEEYLDISKHELNRLSILVDKVMQMSSFEADAAVMELELLDMKEIADQMMSYMKLPFEKNKVSYNYDMTGQNFNILGDRVHMTNVLYNLIDNAMKYSDDHPVIDIHIAEESNHIKFQIMDQGIGIPKEYQNKIFDRFFRVPTDNVHNIKGHGVGLNYVSDVIKKHKGHLHVDSEVGKGTTISFQIPKAV